VHARRREGLAAKRHANFVQKWGVSVWRVRSKSGSKYEASDCIHIGYVPTEARSPCAAHGHKRVHTASESLSPSSNLPLGTPGA
jgi:hypothetical protein